MLHSLPRRAALADIPSMNGIIQTGLNGILQGTQSAARNSARIVAAFSEQATEDPIYPLVDLQRDRYQVEASAQVVKVGDKMLGAVLDILA